MLTSDPSSSVWESEDWLRKYAKPLSQSGGAGRGGGGAEVQVDGDAAGEGEDDAMDEA